MPRALQPTETYARLASEYTLERCAEILRESPEGSLRLMLIAQEKPLATQRARRARPWRARAVSA